MRPGETTPRTRPASRRRRGFTLIELVVALTLLGGLVAGSVTLLSSYRAGMSDRALQTVIASVVREAQSIALARGDGVLRGADIVAALADAPVASGNIVTEGSERGSLPKLTAVPDPVDTDPGASSLPAIGDVRVAFAPDRTAVGLAVRTRTGNLVIGVVGTATPSSVTVVDRSALLPSYRPTAAWALLRAGVIADLEDAQVVVFAPTDGKEGTPSAVAGTPSGVATPSSGTSGSDTRVDLSSTTATTGILGSYLATYGRSTSITCVPSPCRTGPFAAGLVTGAVGGNPTADLDAVVDGVPGTSVTVPAQSGGVTIDLGQHATVTAPAIAGLSTAAPATAVVEVSETGSSWTSTIVAGRGYRWVRIVLYDTGNSLAIVTLLDVQLHGVYTHTRPLPIAPVVNVSATAVAGSTAVRVSWAEVRAATRYVLLRDGVEIYRDDRAVPDDGAQQISVTDQTAGTAHRYTVLASAQAGFDGAAPQTRPATAAYIGWDRTGLAADLTFSAPQLARTLYDGGGVRSWNELSGKTSATGSGYARLRPTLAAPDTYHLSAVTLSSGPALNATATMPAGGTMTMYAVLRWDGGTTGVLGFAGGLGLHVIPGTGTTGTLVARDRTGEAVVTLPDVLSAGVMTAVAVQEAATPTSGTPAGSTVRIWALPVTNPTASVTSSAALLAAPPVRGRMLLGGTDSFSGTLALTYVAFDIEAVSGQTDVSAKLPMLRIVFDEAEGS